LTVDKLVIKLAHAFMKIQKWIMSQ